MNIEKIPYARFQQTKGNEYEAAHAMKSRMKALRHQPLIKRGAREIT